MVEDMYYMIKQKKQVDYKIFGFGAWRSSWCWQWKCLIVKGSFVGGKNKSYHWDLDQLYVVATWSTFICNNLKVLKEMLPKSISFTGLPECLPCLISNPPLCFALSFWG